MNRTLPISIILGLSAFGAHAQGCASDQGDVLADVKSHLTGAVRHVCEEASHACRWSFDLGDDASRKIFEEIRVFLASCPTIIDKEQDAGVNHPDFYEAWLFRTRTGTLTLSLKDKSELHQTFVVLRVVPSP